MDEEIVDCSLSDLSLSTVVSDANCELSDGSVVLQALGGTLPYIYQLNNLRQNGPLFENLTAGEYEAMVTDQQGCSVQNIVMVKNVGGVNAALVFTPSGCATSNGEIEVIASNGTEPYSYRLNNGTSQPDNIFSSLTSGTYTMEVTDVMDCQFQLSVYLPTGISYTQLVEPLIMSSCAVTGCHDGSNSLPDFRSIGVVQANAGMIKSRTQSGNMPKNGTLSENDKAIIACWVDDGALNN